VRRENAVSRDVGRELRRGLVVIVEKGYVLHYNRSHERSDSRGYVPQHIAIAQAAFGKSLPVGAIVHHANGVKDDNRNNNLVICQDGAYHRLLHRRMRVKAAGGNPNTQRICSTCKQMLFVAHDFSPRKIDFSRECRRCVVARVKAYTAQNHDAYLARQAGYRAARRARSYAR